MVPKAPNRKESPNLQSHHKLNRGGRKKEKIWDYAEETEITQIAAYQMMRLSQL
jgi:hypothetical protein